MRSAGWGENWRRGEELGGNSSGMIDRTAAVRGAEGARTWSSFSSSGDNSLILFRRFSTFCAKPPMLLVLPRFSIIQSLLCFALLSPRLWRPLERLCYRTFLVCVRLPRLLRVQMIVRSGRSGVRRASGCGGLAVAILLVLPGFDSPQKTEMDVNQELRLAAHANTHSILFS